MFRNPVYDLMVVVPALLISGLIGFFIMTGSAHAQVPQAQAATSTPAGSPAQTASTSGNTMPDPAQKELIVTRSPSVVGNMNVPSSALAVHSSGELEAYARGALAQDAYISSITLSGHGVVVAYRKQGRLLGLVPVALPTTATVHTDGSITFTAPWYGAVTLAERDRMQSALEVRVHALLTSEGYLASMSLAPATQAEIIDIIRELLA
ncbi:MAG: hypothetical protein JWO84_97 [Parcubacteria group bacterium]|nr:hypothetical protein [Parcubacteria group bacterium]